MQLDPDHISTVCAVGNVDPDIAHKLLVKHNGNLEKAVDACLSGDTGEVDAVQEPIWTQRNNTPEYDASLPQLTGPIDVDNERKFGPSNRAPNPEWAMVPSDAAIGEGRATTPLISHEDQSLNDAIQRSLDDFQDVDDFAFKNGVREGGRPVAIRPEDPNQACAALVVQALFFVPQVRFATATLRLPDVDPSLSFTHPARCIWNLIELFTNLDLGQLSTIVDGALLPSIDVSYEESIPGASPAANAAAVVRELTNRLEAHLSAQSDDDDHDTNRPSLLSFKHLMVEINNRLPSQLKKTSRPEKAGVVTIKIGGDLPERDLVSRLASELSAYSPDGGSSHSLIMEPAEAHIFNFDRLIGGDFTFPLSFYLDRFLYRNMDITVQKVKESQKLSEEISELTNRKTTLSCLNQRNTVQDIKNSIYYFENVAQAKDDPVRQRDIEETITQLKDILLMLESKIEGLDREIKRLEAQLASLFDCPELQQYQYDLRAVLMHTGLPGRKQVYSYVKDAEGGWWKTCDYEVSPVPEHQVLTDTTGVHLGAGPFMVMYSKHLSDQEIRRPVSWPSRFSHDVEENNRKFLAMMSPDVAASGKLSTPSVKYASPSPRRPAAPPLPQRLATPPRTQPVMGPRPSGSGHARAGSSLSTRSMEAPSNDNVQ